MSRSQSKIVFFATTDWYLANFRLGLAHHLRSRGIEIVMVTPPGDHHHRIEAAGFRWIPIDLERRSLNPLRELRLLWRLFRIYQAEKPDLSHHFTIKCVVYGGLIARLTNVRGAVASIDGLGFVFASTSALAQILRPIVSRLLGLALGGRNSRVIVQNPDDYEALSADGLVDRENLRLIVGSGVNTDQFSPNLVPLPSKRPRVLLASRLLWEKGLAEYVEAAGLLSARGYSIEFVMAGLPDPGNPGSVQMEQIEEWRNAGVVSPIGHVDDMAELLKTVNIVVLPSFYREGVPRTLLEGASAGLPIVTTDMPGCRSAVDDGVTGFLIPARSSSALADAIARLVDDPALSARMGAAGRAKMLREFDQQLVFDRTHALYRELVPDVPNNALPYAESHQ